VVGLALVALPFSFGARIAPAGLAGVVMVALGATTRGRLGLLRWWSPRLHHVLDVAAVLLLAAMPLVPGTGGWLLAVFLEPTAAVFALLTLRTNYGPGAAEPLLRPMGVPTPHERTAYPPKRDRRIELPDSGDWPPD
jgi:hypothetical protein